jgi:hypothetical protein
MKTKLRGQIFDTVDEIQAGTHDTKHTSKERLPECISNVAD